MNSSIFPCSNAGSQLQHSDKNSFQNIVFDSVFPMFPVKQTVIYTFFAIKAVNPSKTLLLTVFLNSRGFFHFSPPWRLPKLGNFRFSPAWGLPKRGNFHFSPVGASQAKNFHFPPPWGLPKLGNFHFSPPWGLPKLGNFHFSPPWQLPKLWNFHFSLPWRLSKLRNFK